MTSKWRLIGLVGDVVELNDGEHQIRVETPNDYSLEFVVTVSGKKVTVTSAESHLPNCMPGARITWPIPTVKQSGADEIPMIILADPVFGEHSEVESCVQALMAGCTMHKFVLAATSDPIGAEIWIDGEKQPYRTNTTLSVPFCDHRESIDVLLRADNAVNCSRKVALVPDLAVNLHCSLKVLMRPSKRLREN
ncbi:MAG: hypothetical protein ABIK82_22895 [Pseudomonadota bacterium]